jgi:hypothetical protein
MDNSNEKRVGAPRRNHTKVVTFKVERDGTLRRRGRGKPAIRSVYVKKTVPWNWTDGDPIPDDVSVTA